MPELPTGTVTFLFTDIEGSTRLLAELGPDGYATALAAHRGIVRTALGVHGGVEVDTQGDAFFIAFKDAESALQTAVEVQQASSSGPIRVRMGIHTGAPRVDAHGYVGKDVHLGARIAAAGHGGQILVSKQTRDLAGWPMTDLGEHRLKDFADAVALYQLGDQPFPPLRTISNTNLPRPVSSFVGRDREVAEITAMLRDGARLLTLTGPGGTGKTRLSIEAATDLVAHFKAGVFWVPVASLRDPALVIETVARTLGAKGSLAEHIGEREMLLLVDNLEQVIEAAPDLASVVESCPNLRLLTTSRELLRVRGEVEYPVQPLADQDAVELFVTRSGLVGDEAVLELCRRLDNLPLAVELAAARARVLSPAQIMERLSGRLDLLKGGRDVEARQQTLRAAIEWSHDLLDDDERRLFARLAVFRGGCTLEAAEDVAGADLDLLQSLVEKSLLRHSADRFWMLETIREFAAERFAQSVFADDLRSAHARFFLALAETAEPHLLAPRVRDFWCDRLESEHDNLRAAIDYFQLQGEVEQGMRLAGAIAEFWDQRAHQQEALRRYSTLLEADERPAEARAKALAGGAMMASVCGDLARAERWAEEALQLYRRFDNQFGVAKSLWMLGYLRVEAGDLSTAQEMLSGAVNLLRRVGDETSLLWATRTLAFSYLTMGDLRRARPLHEENLRRSRETGDKALEAATLGGLSGIAVGEGRMRDAVEYERQSLGLIVHIGDVLMAISRLCNSAHVFAALGRAETAARLIGHAMRRYEEAAAQEAWVLKMNNETLIWARKQMGDVAVVTAMSEGAAMTACAALELAVAECEAAAEELEQ
ncbi:MAG: adenylate/guanylate cyclase domain-containing protein [Chloroflexota bacterium]|nr:adenylate/guanylate cyclase domain-containing protein [Chloroflexota bacterium]